MSKNVFLMRKMLIDISLTNEAFSDKTIETLDLLIVNKYKNLIASLLFIIISYKYVLKERNLPKRHCLVHS